MAGLPLIPYKPNPFPEACGNCGATTVIAVWDTGHELHGTRGGRAIYTCGLTLWIDPDGHAYATAHECENPWRPNK